MIVKPFRGLRPRADLSAKIPSYPYDVVNREEAKRLAHDDPHSFLHVVRAEVDLDDAIDSYDDRVYARSRENFLRMIADGWLVRDQQPSFYVYRQRMGEHVQTGIVGAAAVVDYLEGRIKKHEFTRPAKEADRVRVVKTLGAVPGPVFLTHPPDARLQATVAAVVKRTPDVDFVAPDEIAHTLWCVDDETQTAEIESAFAAMPATYVADGHHRTAAAAIACSEMLEQLDDAPADLSCRHFLAVHFPSDQMYVMDYNRVVKDLRGMDTDAFLDRVRAAGFDVTAKHVARKPPARANFGMYLGQSWYLLTAREEILPEAALERLDVSILADRLLGPILGIEDPRTDGRIDFVGGVRGMDGLEARVNSGECAVAFSLYPTSLDDLMQVADAGQVMPPKSTWFEPKLRSGMVVQLLDGEPL